MPANDTGIGNVPIDAGKKKRVFFVNLNGVRAIAALMVVVAHIELEKLNFQIEPITFINLLSLGRVGVTIFFALSGFLITYLLLEEKSHYGKVGFSAFYVRRILRIWPLYFLVVIIGFFIYPKEGSSTALWLSVFFLPNLAFTLTLLPALFDPIWSIGTEEQFYIFHPHFFRIKKNEDILYALIIFLIVFLAGVQLIRHFQAQNKFLEILSSFFYYARFDNMAIGAIVAVLYHNTRYPTFQFKWQKLFDLLFTKPSQILLLISFLAFVYVFLNYKIPRADFMITVLSSLMIVNLCEPKTSLFSLSKRLNFIGEISYGIYLLHKFPAHAVIWGVKTYMPSAGLLTKNLLIYISTILVTIGLASLSYYGYERYFLRLKARFAKITQ